MSIRSFMVNAMSLFYCSYLLNQAKKYARDVENSSGVGGANDTYQQNVFQTRWQVPITLQENDKKERSTG